MCYIPPHKKGHVSICKTIHCTTIMALRLGVSRVSNNGVTAGNVCALFSNGTARVSNLVCSSQITSSLVVCNTVVTTGNVHCNNLSCANVIRTSNLTCTSTVTSNVVTCGNVISSNATCSNLIVTSGINLPNSNSFTGVYSELAARPVLACYGEAGLLYNLKMFTASTETVGTTGKATFTITTDGTSNGAAIFTGAVFSVIATPYVPSARVSNNPVVTVNSISADRKSLVVLASTGILAVTAGTTICVVVYGL